METMDMKFDLNSLKYVENVNSNLICCICQTPFVDPVVLDTCGHTFCQACISQAIAVKPNCPVDRSEISSQVELKSAAKIISNMVNELSVYCPNKDEGCLYTGQRQLVNSHLKDECEYIKLKCRVEECRMLIVKKDLDEHMENCQARLVYCKLCKKKVQFATFEEHSEKCPSKSVDCPYCHTARPLLLHEAHLQDCPEKLTQCPYAEYGCTWTGRRASLSQIHNPSCTYESLQKFFKIYQGRTDTLEHENLQLRSKVQELQGTIGYLQNQVSTLTNWLAVMFPSYFPDSKTPVNINGELSTIPQDILLSENEQIKNDLGNLNVKLADLELRQNVALMTESLRIQEEMQSLKALCHGMRMQIHYSLAERRGDESSINSPSLNNVRNTSGSSLGLSGLNNPPVTSVHSASRNTLSGNSGVGSQGSTFKTKPPAKILDIEIDRSNPNPDVAVGYANRRVGSNSADIAVRQDTKL
ncbi:hypothetical protein G9A89_006269 [Geosiphon pyriformis]|nr:hypothetical protein G9A89_006269 [Geosiphon pyriformis]